jgi:putative membrane protein
MPRFFIRLLVNAFALWVTIQIVPGIVYDGTNLSLLVIALIFGVVNALVRPLLVILTCPLIILTLGLFLFVVNGIMLSLTAWISGIFNLGLYIDGFWATVFGAVVVSVVSGIINTVLKDTREEDNDYKARYS